MLRVADGSRLRLANIADAPEYADSDDPAAKRTTLDLSIDAADGASRHGWSNTIETGSMTAAAQVIVAAVVTTGESWANRRPQMAARA